MNSISTPLVSVMIPYYNCKDYIAETIESIEAQTYSTIEIIVVNDGSQEADTLYLQQLLQSKPHIVLVSQTNKGLPSARNSAAKAAHGKYYLFVDADNKILPTYIEKSVKILEDNDDIKLVYPRAKFFDAEQGEWFLPEYKGYKNLLLGNFFPCSSVHRREDFNKIQGFDENLSSYEDWDYWIRLLTDGDKVCRLDEILFCYRKRSTKDSMIDRLQDNKGLLRRDIQAIYLKHQALYLHNSLALYDYIQKFSENNDLTIEIQALNKKVDTLNLTNSKISKDLTIEVGNLKQQIEALNFANSKYKSLLIIRLLKPLIKLEQGLHSLNRYRKAFRILMKDKGSFGKAYHTIRMIKRQQGIKATRQILKNTFHQQKFLLENKADLAIDACLKDGFVILTTRHTHFIAKLLAENLKKANINSKIIFDTPESGYRADQWYIVICAQIFEELPQHYIAFQMEQSVSDRWFTDKYLDILGKARYVFDYSLKNIEYLHNKDLPFKKIFYLPVGMLSQHDHFKNSAEVDYDIAFYGDPNNDRRQKFLQELKQHFSVLVISEVFGEELYEKLLQAKIIVNIHYYENALLETTRIYECLSLGKLVVSEKSVDQIEHQELSDIVDFTEISNVDDMIKHIKYWLSDDQAFQQRTTDIINLSKQTNKFQFYFNRFLLAHDLMDFESFYRLSKSYVQPKGDFWCLSMAESVERRKDFDQDNHYNIWVFPGLRHDIGWVGCGLSYKFMMRIAEELHLSQVTICEDDVLLPSKFSQRYEAIYTNLTCQREKWDIYSGLISDLSTDIDIKISDVVSDVEHFYSINKLVSTVFNIYNQSSYEKIYSWNHHYRLITNTIDRYIENSGDIRGVVTCPFLVGHKEDLHSTLWGFNNTTYKDMIDNSEKLLKNKISLLAK